MLLNITDHILKIAEETRHLTPEEIRSLVERHFKHIVGAQEAAQASDWRRLITYFNVNRVAMGVAYWPTKIINAKDPVALEALRREAALALLALRIERDLVD